MNGIEKGMLLVLVILYIASPIDACPGPVDDLLVLLFFMASNKGDKGIGDD